MELPALVRDALVVLLAYLCGAIPVSVLVARATGGIDPRTVGSGRTGGTNALRALGPRRAAIVAIGDVAKGYVPVVVAQALTADPLIVSVAGLAAIVGAMRSVFLGFGGGRGVSTGIGTMLAIAPLAIVLATPVFVGVIAVTRYVSAGSLIGSATVAVITAILWAVPGYELELVYVAFAFLGAALVWIAHRDNIERLRAGTERRLDLGSLVRRTGEAKDSSGGGSGRANRSGDADGSGSDALSEGDSPV